MTPNFLTGAAASDFTGHISHLEAETGHETDDDFHGSQHVQLHGHENLRGGERRGGVLGRHRVGDHYGTTAQTNEKDTITGGTGRFAGASGTYTDTVSFVVVSVTAAARQAASPLLSKDRSATRQIAWEDLSTHG